ncbi:MULTISPECIES: hypothetical protein [Enterobacteriaceae]|uniref:hypothetical protein n=1 Tax=Enterobacteriaceae TaxID=543 RepID=UPI0016AF3F6B|nr:MULTISPECIES: hypothetical protein [Enterobacteriaceae]EFJ8746346.1 hypothetical protein [Escherichia coli]EKY3945766.1 hypothetical protein [Enterobacter hormaechei]HCL6052291.1 hypothetical protein [Raoultella ornithinolytica]HED2155590.1 hypothetical protein [Klebsiella variicola subsp. variicola]HED2253971.1 hypothetical protein [Citrobacter freundii]HEE9992464.1 hypothetical protein [Citrobacter braakii]
MNSMLVEKRQQVPGLTKCTWEGMPVMVIDVGYAGKSIIECLKDTTLENMELGGINPFDEMIEKTLISPSSSDM